MIPEPSNEYQKLVEAVARAITEEIGWGTFSHFDPENVRRISHAALSALKPPHAGDDGWQDIAELKPKFGEVLGWADGCGYEVVRCSRCQWPALRQVLQVPDATSGQGSPRRTHPC